MHGWISQIPLAVLTMMTTGRSYLQQTAYGLIEWTHTEQSDTIILNGTVWDSMRGCLIAKPSLAYRNIKRVGRNIDLVVNPSDVDFFDKIVLYYLMDLTDTWQTTHSYQE